MPNTQIMSNVWGTPIYLVRLMLLTLTPSPSATVMNKILSFDVPSTIEYFQEPGRCGRDGLLGSATIYYNSYDVSTAKKYVAINVSQSNKCKREIILSSVLWVQATHTCCDFHQEHFKCKDRNLISASQMFELQENTQLQSTSVADEDCTTLTAVSWHWPEN